jgi:deoxyribodipyrimidine photo-lyase
MLDSVTDLRQRLRSVGSELLVTVGKPEDAIPKLCADLKCTVIAQTEVMSEELAVEKQLRANLDVQGSKLQLLWGATLYHVDDLPVRPNCAAPLLTCLSDAPLR